MCRYLCFLALMPLVLSFAPSTSVIDKSAARHINVPAIKSPPSFLSALPRNCGHSHETDTTNNRRRLFTSSALGIMGAYTALTVTPLVEPAHAVATAANSKEVLNTLLTRLRSVPTFCLVNEEGIPFMVIKQQEGMAKGYAFTSMEGAVIVLGDAQKTAKEKGYFDVWEQGTVVTLPADVAVRLALQKRDRIPTRGTGKPLGSLVDLIPTNQNREDALLIDKRAFQDQGKVPLFYVSGLDAGDGSLPLFLQKSALIAAWQEKFPGQAIPPIQVIDITYMFEAALRGYVDKIPNGGNVSFIPDPEQVEIAQKLRNKGLTNYRFDKMVV